MILAVPGIYGQACGKAILIGEHAAVAGFAAIALPLKAQKLTLQFGEPLESINDGHENIEGWKQAWSLFIGDAGVPLPSEERTRLTKSLELGLKLLAPNDVVRSNLASFDPQKIEIHSQLPLGAGMGGSAALSAAMLRALSQALGIEKTSLEIASFANELDGVFHGRASGLDAATVVSDGIIRFKRGEGAQRIANKKPFWLLLVDTQERTPTRTMVQRVAELREKDSQRVEHHFSLIGLLSERARQNLQLGQLSELGENLNTAHESLQALGVSTNKLDSCVVGLRQAGALGAKLTGGGGGGLALGLFASQPKIPISTEWGDAPHYLTFVPADESS